MNDCPNGELRDLLPDLLHDRLNAAERRRVEAHVAECEDCRAELALLRDLRGTLRRVPAVEVGAIVAAIPPYRPPVRRSWGGWHAAAAAALIAVGGTSIAIASHTSVPPTAATAAATAPVAVTTPVIDAPAPTSTVSRAVAVAHPTRTRELPASGTVADLSDQELATLLDGIETLDVIPSADVEPVVPAAATTSSAQGQS